MNNSCVVVRVYVLRSLRNMKLMHTINMKYVCINSIHLRKKSLNQHLTALYSLNQTKHCLVLELYIINNLFTIRWKNRDFIIQHVNTHNTQKAYK